MVMLITMMVATKHAPLVLSDLIHVTSAACKIYLM
jgi:hypothetical protein